VTHIFHEGGGEAIARELGLAFLGKVPLDPGVVNSGDGGMPPVVSAPDSLAAMACRKIAATITDDGAGAPGLATPFAWTVSDDTGKPAAATGSGTSKQLFALDHDAGRRGLGCRHTAQSAHSGAKLCQ